MRDEPRLNLVFGSEAVETLPRGPHRLEREEVSASQRGRVLDAMAVVVAEKGYAATTVGDVVARARVSRRSFYEHFEDKEACFLAAYEVGARILLSRFRHGVAREAAWRDTVREIVRAYLGFLSAEPAFARAFVVEVTQAGPLVAGRRDEMQGRFADLLGELQERARASEPALPVASRAALLALIYGISELASRRVRAGRAEELPELEDDLVGFAISVFVGPR